MRLPKQTASVVRDLHVPATDAGAVAPSGILDVLGGIAKVAAPIVGSLI